MAYKKQVEEVVVDEFYLPLTPGELKEMYTKYANDNGVLMFYSPYGHSTTGKELYLNDNKIMSYDKKYGWAIYEPNKHELPKFLRKWEEFEEYAKKRAYAIKKELENYANNQPVL